MLRIRWFKVISEESYTLEIRQGDQVLVTEVVPCKLDQTTPAMLCDYDLPLPSSAREVSVSITGVKSLQRSERTTLLGDDY